MTTNFLPALRYIVHKCVPAAVLELDEPGEFEIPAALRRKASETVLEACRDAIGDSLTGACKANFKVCSSGLETLPRDSADAT